MIKYKGLSTLEILEVARNYNKWIAEQCLPHIRVPLLEVGSGTGNISMHFTHKKNVVLTDIDKGLVSFLRQKFLQKSIAVEKLNIAGKITKKEKYNTIIAINVIEHIKNEKKALANMHKLLRKNGKLILLVPAKKFAFTQLDRRLGHFRRYEENELYFLINKAGFTIKKLYYFNFIGLWSWILRSKLEKTHSLKSYQVSFFDKIVPILKIIEKYIKIPVGVSLIVIAVKK